jgi:hypothetical protein
MKGGQSQQHLYGTRADDCAEQRLGAVRGSHNDGSGKDEERQHEDARVVRGAHDGERGRYDQ